MILGTDDGILEHELSVVLADPSPQQKLTESGHGEHTIATFPVELPVL